MLYKRKANKNAHSATSPFSLQKFYSSEFAQFLILSDFSSDRKMFKITTGPTAIENMTLEKFWNQKSRQLSFSPHTNNWMIPRLVDERHFIETIFKNS